MLRVSEGVGGPSFGGEDIDRSALIDTVFVRFPPGSLGNGHDARPDAKGDAAGQNCYPPVVEDPDAVPVPDAAYFGIDGIDEQPLRKGLLKPVRIVQRGVDTGHVVVADTLEGIQFGFRAEGALPLLNVLGNGRNVFGVFNVEEFFRKYFDLSGGVGRGKRFGSFRKSVKATAGFLTGTE